MPKSAQSLINRPEIKAWLSKSLFAPRRPARRGLDPLIKKAAAETAGIVSIAAVMLLAVDCLFNGGLLR